MIASKYAKGIPVQKLPLLRTIITKRERIIIRHELKVQNVQDRMSRRFCSFTSASEVKFPCCSAVSLYIFTDYYCFELTLFKIDTPF